MHAYSNIQHVAIFSKIPYSKIFLRSQKILFQGGQYELNKGVNVGEKECSGGHMAGFTDIAYHVRSFRCCFSHKKECQQNRLCVQLNTLPQTFTPLFYYFYIEFTR